MPTFFGSLVAGLPYAPDDMDIPSQGSQPAVVNFQDSPLTLRATSDARILDDQPNDPLSIWMDFSVRTRYEADGHVYMMGVTSPGGFAGQSVAFCQLAAPTLLWIFDWTASRWNTPPQVPDPRTYDTGWVWMDAHIEPAQMNLARDGQTPLYRISGTYVYGHTAPQDLFSMVVWPLPPWMDGTGLARTIPVNGLVRGVGDVPGIAPGGPVGGGGGGLEPGGNFFEGVQGPPQP